MDDVIVKVNQTTPQVNVAVNPADTPKVIVTQPVDIGIKVNPASQVKVAVNSVEGPSVSVAQPSDIKVNIAPPVPVNVVVSSTGKRGLKGDKGDTGDSGGNYYMSLAGQDLSGNRVVYINNDKAYLFDPEDVSLYARSLGITVGAALIDEPVIIQVIGVMDWTSSPLIPNTIYYAGADGLLTNNPNNLKVMQRIGPSLSASKLKINFDLNVITI